MLTFFGIVLLLLAAGIYTLNKINANRRMENTEIELFNRKETTRHREEKKRIIQLPTTKWYLPLIVGIFVLIFGIANPIDRNEYGFRQVVENPISGNTWVQFDQGIYFKGFFAHTTTYPNAITVKYAKLNEESSDEEISSLNLPTKVRFSDAASADVEATVKFRLSDNEDEMLLTHKDNRTHKKLTETVLEPYTDECLNFSAQLMESETHYSGGKSKMSEDFQSQLEAGPYIIVVKTEYIQDSISNTNRKITQTNTRVDQNGLPIRKKSNILQYGVTIAAATIETVDYDPLIDKKLEAKIDASTRESISKQLAITAEQEAITAKRQGEKLIAETEAREQSAKREAIIRAEKQTAVDEESAKQAIFKGRATLALKKAEAEGDKLKVAAGLSPREKAQFDKETSIGIAAELAKRSVPQFIMSGGNNNQSSLANSYTMEQMLLMMNKINKKN